MSHDNIRAGVIAATKGRAIRGFAPEAEVHV